ncbi:unnamed protein product [Arabis nemorensis]|uniref:Uncharacterized protein n=1 Tax=Arabis nemorensis TaxID=586526 RepID=A0A565CFN2_9BRAS|nr:unnamed protein product [Arabis nemorensis]
MTRNRVSSPRKLRSTSYCRREGSDLQPRKTEFEQLFPVGHRDKLGGGRSVYGNSIQSLTDYKEDKHYQPGMKTVTETISLKPNPCVNFHFCAHIDQALSGLKLLVDGMGTQ